MNTGSAGRSRGASGVLLATAVALAVLTFALAAPRWTAALLGDTQAVGGNTFSASNCFQARLGSVQSGTAASSANGTLTVGMTAAVNPASAFLLFNIRHNSNRPVGSLLRGRIATSTTLEFVRVTDEAAPVTIDIRWYVVEYACGVSVQRGQVTQTATTIDIPITPVGAVGRAFVTWSKTPVNIDTNWSQDDPVIMELTSTSNLQLRVDSANASHVIWWQVVEFTIPGDISVQQGTTSLLGAALSTPVTLPTPVDVGRTFVLVNYRTAGTGPDVGARMLRAELTDSTTITIDRSVSGTPDDITEIHWQAIELNEGSRVQRGSATLAAGAATASIAIQPIAVGRSAAFASVQSGGGQNTGRSPYVADDVVGVGAVTASLTSTQLTLDRTSTAAATDIGWFVVEWGGPPWWNAAYNWRRAIDVTAGAAIAAGYSLSVTFDHAGLVGAGKALANGNDVRVVYWNGSGWVQLARFRDEGSAWNTSATQVWFRAQSPVAAGASDGNYFMYYGNSAPGGPPANPSNVFFFYDRFPGPGLSASWTVLRPPAAGWSVSGTLSINMDPNEDFWGATNNAPLFHVAAPAGDFEAQVEQFGRPIANGHTGGILDYQDDDNYIADYHDNIAGAETVEYVREAAGAPTSQTVGVSSNPLYLRIRKLGTSYTGWYSTNGGATFTQVGTPQTITLGPIRIGLTAFSFTTNVRTMSFDNIRVRNLVNPEPSSSLRIEDRP
ncbi:MAG: hypothetical protein ACRDGU_06310 [Actinomycetota bacterium]